MVFEDDKTQDAWIKLRLDEVTRHDIGYVKSLQTRMIRVPSQFSEDPKFFSSGELTRLSEAPEGFDGVRRKMDQLAAALATESVRNALAVTRDRAVLDGVLSARYVVSAAEVTAGDADAHGGLVLGGGVRVAYYADGDTAGEPDRTYLRSRGPRAGADQPLRPGTGDRSDPDRRDDPGPRVVRTAGGERAESVVARSCRGRRASSRTTWPTRPRPSC